MLPKVAKRAATFPDRLTFHVLFSVTRMKIHNGKSFGILFYAHKIECMKMLLYMCANRVITFYTISGKLEDKIRV